MKHIMEQQGNCTSLKLVGAVGIDHTLQLHQSLKAAVSSSSNVKLDLENVGDVSMAGMQLICATRRTVTLLNKTLTFTPGSVDRLRKICKRSGCSSIKACLGEVQSQPQVH